MFSFKKRAHVRVISPSATHIEPTFIAVPLPDGKLLVMHGKFEDSHKSVSPDAEPFVRIPV